MEAYLQEIFSSIQGEGIFVGVRQIFVRFSQCNLNCAYCDTASGIKPVDYVRIESVPGTKEFGQVPNPISVEKLQAIIYDLNPSVHHSISLTGGEPLLQYKFIKNLLTNFKPDCLLFLETNGILYQALADVIPYVDIISMDLKLPTATGNQWWEAHEKFLRLASEKTCYVKIVVSADTLDEEIDKAINLVCRVDDNIPMVLQPVTPYGVVQAAAPGRIIKLQDRCSKYLKNVRVIPQTHRMINQL